MGGTGYDYSKLGLKVSNRREPLGSATKGLWVLPVLLAIIMFGPWN